MKKVIAVLSILFALFFTFSTAYSKPILIGGIKVYWGKWAVTLGECQSGNGLCFQIGIGEMAPQNWFGYDPETDKVIVKISKKEQESGHIIHSILTIEEDSPVNPKLIEKIKEFSVNGKIVRLRKGVYRAIEDENFYTFSINYYLQ